VQPGGAPPDGALVGAAPVDEQPQPVDEHQRGVELHLDAMPVPLDLVALHRCHVAVQAGSRPGDPPKVLRSLGAGRPGL
jgi:hypothetical protein